ncbi:hypothetical protein CCHL11_01189 [Colletotrichum chlorophyti]|uniref:Uncharacterized protein n=1 Tax=Colletotrichum chlorophyti TaxID=708187 RepID=A0A1Q8S7M6_9PEZI|nr:hypothetical protein CCHL11_01189 [Colletotrichum chlorophyti]
MLPSPPTSPGKEALHHTVADFVSAGNRRRSQGRCAPERSLTLRHQPKTSAEQPHIPGDQAIRHYHFRRRVLFLLEQQHAAIEAWADSVGAGGPAEPMDWQPEQERVVYVPRSPLEDGCYTDKWRVGGEEGLLAMPEMVSWADEAWVDGPMMWGASAAGTLEEVGEVL